MEGFKNLNFQWSKIIKIGAIVIGIIVLLAIFVNLVLGPVFSRLNSSGMSSKGSSLSNYSTAVSPSQGATYKSESSMGLSIRNAEVAMDNFGAENYEVTQYNATVETGKLKEDCAFISELKNKDYVVFENSNVAEYYCNFSFKVNKENVEEILAIIKNLKPRDLNQNIESIKKEIEDFTSREEILKNKQASIDETLKNALVSYDEITNLATKTNNADSLAKVIDSKINILERLTSQRLQVSSELETLARAKAEQLDRLKYVNFYVYIYENKIIDGQVLKDYWVNSAKQFVSNINQLLKDLSFGLAEILLLIVKYLVYIFLLVIAAKFCWKLGKSIWKK